MSAIEFFYQHLTVMMIAIPLAMAPVMILLKENEKIQKIVDITVSLILVALAIFLFRNVWMNGIQVYEVGELL